MKKELRQLIIPLAILIVLVVALAVYLIVDAVKKKNLDDELAPVSVSVADANLITDLRIEYANNDYMSFSFEANGSVSGAEHNGVTFEKEKIQQNYVKDLLSSLTTLSLVKELESPSSDRSVYGLDPAAYKVTLTKRDGSQSVILFGKELEDKSGMYASLDASGKLLVAKNTYVTSLALTFENYLNLYAVAIPVTDVDTIKFARTSSKETIVVKPVEDNVNDMIVQTTYKVIEPIERDTTAEMKNLLNKLLALQVTSFLDISDEQKPEYGLDKPEYVFDFKLKSGDVQQLFLSKDIGGFYYGYVSGNPYCFKISSSSLTGLNLPLDQLMSFYVFNKLEYLDTVASATVQMKEGTFEVEYVIDESSKSILNANSQLRLNKRDAKVFTKDGEYCYAILLFESIFRMKIDHIDSEATPELKDPDVTITVIPLTGSTYTIKLQKIDSEYYYCFINDIYSGFIVNRSVLYRDNGQFLSEFGIWDAYKLVNEAIDNKDIDGRYDRVDKESANA